jgi:hypothetical protein
MENIHLEGEGSICFLRKFEIFQKKSYPFKKIKE